MASERTLGTDNEENYYWKFGDMDGHSHDERLTIGYRYLPPSHSFPLNSANILFDGVACVFHRLSCSFLFYRRKPYTNLTAKRIADGFGDRRFAKQVII